MPAREARLAANEGVFRELNEQIEWLSGDERRLTIVCECGTLECDERLTISESPSKTFAPTGPYS
jgi:hypothetical protein